MKRIYLLFLIYIFSISVYSQTTDTELKPKQIIEQRKLYLNGGTRATFGGKSRTSIKIDLPPNTVKWYYSFTTSPGQSGTKNLNLLTQLSSLVVDPTGLTATAIHNVKVPTGSQSIDVYLCDGKNINNFMKKVDNWGGDLYYIKEGSVQNTKQGVIEIDDVNQGTWYLGLKNPSSLDGVNITIEVVAIIENSEKKDKAELYGSLGWKQYLKGDYQKCIEYCDKANSYYEFGWVLGNKGLSLLMLGKQDEALETYINAITVVKKQKNPKYVFSELLKDINNALSNNPNLDGATDIKELLEMEYQKYE